MGDKTMHTFLLHNCLVLQNYFLRLYSIIKLPKNVSAVDPKRCFTLIIHLGLYEAFRTYQSICKLKSVYHKQKNHQKIILAHDFPFIQQTNVRP